MGIKDAYYTVRVKDRSGSEQHVIANVNMYVTLPRNLRARTCRVEVPHQHEREISVESFRDILEELTKRAYDNPKFVEGIVCDVAARLNSEDHVRCYIVEMENFESIQNHSAYALIEKDKDADNDA